MFAKRKYMDGGDEREMGLKRPQPFDSSSSYFEGPSGSSLMYNASYAYSGEPPPFPVVRLRGLPFGCTEADVIDFLGGLDLLDILFVHKGGRFTGEAFCVMAYPLQVDFAIQRDRRNMGRRYIEVFRSTRQEYYSAIANEVSDMRGGSPRRGASRAKPSDDGKDVTEHTGILRMRGLPYSAGKEDILDFFKDYELSEDRIHIALNEDSRPSGEAYVEFANPVVSRTAMAKDRMTLGRRYIELFPSTTKELDDALSKGFTKIASMRGGSPHRGTSSAKLSDDGKDLIEHTGILRMRGLPYSAGKEDILDFFKDYELSEDRIHIALNADSRPSGEAYVEFANPITSLSAMAKDRMTLGRRYIELFPSTTKEIDDALSKGR